MGLQLIFVVESNKNCNSDWIYIKDTIDHFYEYDKVSSVKLTPIYMDGKGKYKNKVKEVNNKINQYNNMSKNNETRVIYCFDCDDYDTKPEDYAFQKQSQQFCMNHGYEYVWFCKDIERVYIGKKVPDSQKKKEAAIFKAKKLIANVNHTNLSANALGANRSNILSVLDRIKPQLVRK